MPIYEIPLPNGTIVEIEDEPGKEREARLRARQYFQQSDPEGFAKWNESRPLQGFGEAFVGAGRGALGSTISGAAPVATQIGLPGEQTIRDIGKAVSGEESLDTRGFEGFSDLARQFAARPWETAKAAAGTALGSVAGSVAAPLAAAALAAGAGPAAVGAVGLGTAIVTGALSSINELESLLQQENVDPDTARRLAVGVGGLIGAGEGGAAGALISRTLGRQLRRETVDGLMQMSQRSAANAAARGTLAGIALEGGSEAAGGTAREATAALASGNLDIANRADRVLLDAAMGSIGGGAMTALGASRDPARARAELEARGLGPSAPPPAPEAPPEPEAPPILPPAPVPIATGEEARAFLEANRETIPTIDVPDDESAIALANRYQNLQHRQEVTRLRADQINRFLGTGSIRSLFEQDEKGNEIEVEDRGVQADNLYRRLLEVAKNPENNFNLGSFTIQDVTDQALKALGPEAEGATREERALVREQLRALRNEGYLIEGDEGRNTFGLPGRDIEALREGRARREGERLQQPGERGQRLEESPLQKEFPGLAGLVEQAPETAQQETARRVGEYFGSGNYLNADPKTLERIGNFLAGNYRGIPRQQLIEFRDTFGNRPDAQVANLFNEYVDGRNQLNELAAERRVNPELDLTPNLERILGLANKPEPRAQWPEDGASRQNLLREIENIYASQQADRIERLTGTAAPAGVTKPEGETELRVPGAGTPGFPGTESPLAILEGINAANEKQRNAILNQFFADPEQARAILEDLTKGRAPRENMSWKKWQQAFRENNIDIPEAVGKRFNEEATKMGIVDGLGRLKWRDVDAPATKGAAPAPAPKAPLPMPPAKPKAPLPLPPAPKPKAEKPLPMPPKPKAPEPKAAPAPKPLPLPKPKVEAAPAPTPLSNKTLIENEVAKQGGILLFQEGDIGVYEFADGRTGDIDYTLVRAYPNIQSVVNFTLSLHKQSTLNITNAEASKIADAIARRKLQLEELAAANPKGPFEKSSFVVTEGIPKNLADYAKNLLKLLQIDDRNIIIISKAEAAKSEFTDKYKMYGPYSFMRSASGMGNNTFGQAHSNRAIDKAAITIDTSLSPQVQIEVIAHEIGHLFQRVAYNSAPREVQAKLRDAFNKFLQKTKDESVGEYISSLRPPFTAVSVRDINKLILNEPASEKLGVYWRSFNEWFADNVAKWATTNEVPRSLIDRFFKKIADAYHKIVASFKGQGLPDQAVEDFIKSYIGGTIVKKSGISTASDASASLDNLAVQHSLTTPHLPTDTAAAHKVVKQTMEDQIKGIFKWFASPIMTMGKVKPALRAAAAAMRHMYTRTQEASDELTEMLAPAARLKPEARAKITRIAEEASRNRKAPDTSNLSAEEKAALKGLLDMGQRAFDYLQEAYVMKYFEPDDKKSPAERSRLEKLWDKHDNAHLWEIPAKELAAASPEGFRKMQEIDRLRNPYYFPQLARGSHFVAAYKKGPGGKSDIVRLIPYTPLNMAQKLRGFPDPERAAIAELRKEFPNEGTHRIMDRGQQFTRDEEASKLRNQGDFIAEYLQRLREVSTKSGQQVIADMQKELDKAQLDRLFRPNQNILRAITPDNETSYVMDALPQYALSVAKIQARRYTQDEWTKSLENLSPNDKSYLNDLRDYATTPTEAFGAARGAAFFMYLGGALDTAIVNATQPFQVTLPMLVRDGGLRASKYLASAYNTVLLNKDLGKLMTGELEFTRAMVKNILKGDEADAVLRAVREGIFTPVYTNESRGQFTAEGLSKAGIKNAAGTAAFMNKVTNLMGKPMQVVELTNRLATFLAAYRLAQADPKAVERSNRADNTDFADAYSYATNKVFDTQFMTSKEDRAYIQRFSPGAEVATQFMSFPLKMIEQYVRHGSMILEGISKSDPFMARAGFVGLAGMALPLVMLAGIWGLPGADFTKELLEKLAAKLFGGAQNFDADAREWLGGGRFAEAVLRGIPHASGMMALTNRIKIDPVPMQELTPMSVFGMMGPVGGLAEAFLSRMPEYINNGDYWNAAAVMMPRAVGNVIRGANLYVNEEQLTQRGNRMLTPEILRSYNETTAIPAAARQALGFPAPELVNLREAVALGEEINRQMREPTEKANKELARYLTRGLDARRDGDAATMAREFEKFRKRVAEINQENEGKPLDRRIILNQSTIEQRALQDFLGLPDPRIMQRRGSVQMRPEIQRQTQALLWRNPSQAP